MESTRELSARFTALFNDCDRSTAEHLLAPQVTFHGGSAGEFTTRDELFGMISGYRAAFPDAHSVVEDQIAEGDRVVTRWTATGTGPNEKPFVLRGITIERIEDGRIAEVWMNRDDVSMQLQLELASQPLTTLPGDATGREIVVKVTEHHMATGCALLWIFATARRAGVPLDSRSGMRPRVAPRLDRDGTPAAFREWYFGPKAGDK